MTDPKDREALLVQKFRLCQVQFDWKEDGERTFGAQQSMARAKEVSSYSDFYIFTRNPTLFSLQVKRQILCELVEIVGDYFAN